MRGSRPYRLRVLLPALLGLFSLAAFGGLLAERLSTARQDRQAEARRSLSVAMYQLSNTLSALLPRGLEELADRAVVDASLDSRLDLLVVADDRGRVLYSSRRAWVGTPVSEVPGYDPRMAAPFVEGGQGSAVQEAGPLLRAYYPVELGLRSGELRASRHGILFAQYDSSWTLARVQDTVWRQAARAALLLLLCVALLAGLLHLLLTRRVERLSAVMAAVASGDLQARASIRGSDEIARLAQAFDAMAEELAAKQEALRLARFSMENAADGIFWIRGDGTVFDANEAACRSLGYSRQELLGMQVTDFDPDMPPGAWEQHWEELRRVGSVNFLRRHRTRDGRFLDVEISANRITFEGMDMNCALARDVTERKRIEAELQHAQKLESLGRLAGGVAHDVNNVLAAVLGLTSALKEGYAADPALAEGLGTIERAALRGRDLVRGLTEFARKDLQQVDVLDLNDLVLKELALFDRTTFRKIEVQADLAPGPLEIQGDATRLASALMNLWVNAKDAMPDGGLLLVSTQRVGDSHVRVVVEDTGPGMTEEVKARALEPFFTTKPPGKGTGLGLPMVYGAVKSHGGTLELGDREGGGTRIVMTFPGSCRVPGTEEVPVEPVRDLDSGVLRILVTDDDESIRMALPAMLGFLGHEVETASSALEALERLDRGPAVDLVVLDQNMPGQTGAQTLPALRERHSGTRILIATGFRDAELEQALLEYPDVGLIMKPFLLDELRRALQPLATRVERP